MTKTRSTIALFAMLAVIGAAVAAITGTASADGRTLEGSFCTANHFCMSLSFGDTNFSSNTRPANATGPDMTLRPGTYWITVTDNSNFHNFSWRSCPGSSDSCTSSNPASGGTDQDLTPVCNDPLTAAGTCPPTNPAAKVIEETFKVNLTHGTYSLFCDSTNHESLGMYVDIAVGGVGQVG
jgi:hypothetical protein